jgi:hypothetical protein
MAKRGLKNSVMFMVTDEEKQWLVEQSALTGAPQAEIIRRAIKVYRERLEATQKKEEAGQ